MSTSHTRVGVGVIVVRDGRVLLGQRQGSHGAGSWALPGGNLDFGESVEDCAARELVEETGLLAGSIRPAQFTVDFFPETPAHDARHYVTLFVEAHEVRGEPENLEPEKCAGWDWFWWDRLPEPVFGPLRSLQRMGYTPTGVTLRGT